VTIPVTLFGIDNTTGTIVTFVTVNNVTKVIASNATALERNSGYPIGVGVIVFKIPSIGIKAGDQIKACNLVLETLKVVCASTEKPLFSDTIFLQLFLQ
jgi:hypothetical protein